MNTMSKAELFIFSHYKANWDQGDLEFHYEVVRGTERIPFVERWHLNAPHSIEHIPTETLESVLQSLHLIIGTSYFKAYCPRKIEILEYTLQKSQAQMWNEIYTKGLGEFYYKNRIDFRGFIQFPYVENEIVKESAPILLDEKALVMHGGGKDSIVSAEIVKASNMPFDLFCLNPKDIQNEVAKKMQKEILSITRHIDPKLLELNKKGDVYNGHVPISTFYTFAAVLQALLCQHRYIIISSERSSSYGNVEYLGSEINHQWSKSDEAEKLLRSYIKTYISDQLEYFSMLRPWYEIQVAQRFAEMTTYFEVFSSSNHNFTIDENKNTYRWKYDSPKTLFVFAILSAFLTKEDMIKIFEEDLYNKSELLPFFRELLGLESVKPFECVGTPYEMMVAMKMAYESGMYDGEAAMNMFKEKIISKNLDFDELKTKVFSKGDDSGIPEKFRILL